MLDLLHEIAQTMRNNRLRTLLTGISVAWGIFMLIVLLGAARGVKNSFEENIGSSANNTISIWSGRTTRPYKGYKDGRWIKLKESDGEAMIADHPDVVESVAPYASVDTAKISTSRDVLTDGFVAVYPEAQKTMQPTILAGRFINEPDIQQARRVMVLQRDNAALLFGTAEDALGKTVKSLGLAWTVVGIYGDRWQTSSIVPYTAYKAVTGNDGSAYQLDITVKNLFTAEDATEAEDKVRATMARVHNYDVNDRNAIWTWNRFESYLRGLTANKILTTVVWIIGLLTLLTGIVGVSNIMFVSVRERTHEIGVRRAIGAKPRAILTQILAESVGITAFFGYIGVFLGMIVLQVVNHFTKDVNGFSNPTVDITMALEVTAALIFAGAIAGLFPAMKALKVKPVEALRDE